MRALILVACLAACGDNSKGRHDAGAGDAATPDAMQSLQHCLDDRAALVRPPDGQLPCDLLPPGFGQ